MDWGLIGHDWAVDLLADHVAHGRERHAYLLTGPQGVGKRTLALRFAQCLNCLDTKVPGKPCGICSPCKKFEAMQHPDLTLVEADQQGGVLRIDQVREMQHNLSLAPYEAKYRIALLLRFEEANQNTANALLKTLEEPPRQVVVILTANSAENLLPTIVSRCEVIRLRVLSVDETSIGLQQARGIPAETADRLAHISGGRPGYAIRLYEQPQLLEQRQSWLEELFRILGSSRGERFALAMEMSRDNESMRSKLQVWLSLWRDVLLNSTGINHALTNQDQSEQVKFLAEHISLSEAQNNVQSVAHTLDYLDHNVNARLALEVMLMDFPRINISL
jgi:DNA polymerase III subunit delta'